MFLTIRPLPIKTMAFTLASIIPVVSTDVDGFPELIENGKSVIIVTVTLFPLWSMELQ